MRRADAPPKNSTSYVLSSTSGPGDDDDGDTDTSWTEAAAAAAAASRWAAMYESFLNVCR